MYSSPAAVLCQRKRSDLMSMTKQLGMKYVKIAADCDLSYLRVKSYI